MARHQRYRWQHLYDRRETPSPPDVRQEEPRFEREPMTEAQARFLAELCEDLNVRFDPTWSRSRASREINRLKKLRAARQRRRTGG